MTPWSTVPGWRTGRLVTDRSVAACTGRPRRPAVGSAHRRAGPDRCSGNLRGPRGRLPGAATPTGRTRPSVTAGPPHADPGTLDHQTPPRDPVRQERVRVRHERDGEAV